MFTIHRLRIDRRTAIADAAKALPIAISLLCPPTAWALDGTATITGTAHVLDGDTLEIGTTRIRLFGIDAPEGAQTCKDPRGGTWACGRSARRALERLTTGQAVTCRGRGIDDYGRL